MHANHVMGRESKGLGYELGVGKKWSPPYYTNPFFLTKLMNNSG